MIARILARDCYLYFSKVSFFTRSAKGSFLKHCSASVNKTYANAGSQFRTLFPCDPLRRHSCIHTLRFKVHVDKTGAYALVMTSKAPATKAQNPRLGIVECIASPSFCIIWKDLVGDSHILKHGGSQRLEFCTLSLAKMPWPEAQRPAEDAAARPFCL